jgi:hypothetical protein
METFLERTAAARQTAAYIFRVLLTGINLMQPAKSKRITETE